MLCFLPSAPQGSPKWVLRRRPRKFGGRRAERERERESRAKPELRPRTRSPPPLEGGGEGAVPDLLALLSAFCAAGQPKVGATPQAEKIWWLVAGGRRATTELRGRESDEELRGMGTSPRSACSAFCLLRRRSAPKAGAAPQRPRPQPHQPRRPQKEWQVWP